MLADIQGLAQCRQQARSVLGGPYAIEMASGGPRRRARVSRGEAMREQLGWDRPLRFRRGARERLRGIELYYDLNWSAHFPDRRAEFRGGQNLADLVIRECPEGKRPALLLTDRADVQQGGQQTDSHHVVVINLSQYVASAEDPGTAQSYLARILGGGITLARRFSALTEDEVEEAARWLDEHLDEAALLRWARGNEVRRELLRHIADGERSQGGASEDDAGANVQRALDALEALESISPEVAEAIARLAARDDENESRLEMLWALTEDDEGRALAGETLSARVDERLNDARSAADAFDELLASAGETAVQRFLEEHPWLLGLDYARVRARQPIVRGAVDFLLERFDGFHDMLELKSPDDPLFETIGPETEIGSPSTVRLSRPLSLALAQVHVYRDILRHEATHAEMYGLQNTRDPQITILIGRASGLTEQHGRVLHELNRSLHHVEIVPFDVLARRAHAVLDNVKRYLVAADQQTASDG